MICLDYTKQFLGTKLDDILIIKLVDQHNKSQVIQMVLLETLYFLYLAYSGYFTLWGIYHNQSDVFIFVKWIGMTLFGWLNCLRKVWWFWYISDLKVHNLSYIMVWYGPYNFLNNLKSRKVLWNPERDPNWPKNGWWNN